MGEISRLAAGERSSGCGRVHEKQVEVASCRSRRRARRCSASERARASLPRRENPHRFDHEVGRRFSTCQHDVEVNVLAQSPAAPRYSPEWPPGRASVGAVNTPPRDVNAGILVRPGAEVPPWRREIEVTSRRDRPPSAGRVPRGRWKHEAVCRKLLGRRAADRTEREGGRGE